MSITIERLTGRLAGKTVSRLEGKSIQRTVRGIERMFNMLGEKLQKGKPGERSTEFNVGGEIEVESERDNGGLAADRLRRSFTRRSGERDEIIESSGNHRIPNKDARSTFSKIAGGDSRGKLWRGRVLGVLLEK